MEQVDFRKPYGTLDMWRGIAALAVTIHHTTNIFLLDSPGFKGSLLGKLCWAMALGVEMFFVISGYCITAAACSTLLKPDANWKTFAMARLRRIFPPYWFALLGWAVLTLTYALLHRHHSLQHLMGPDGFGQPVPAYLSSITLTSLLLKQSFLYGIAWTLCYEVAFYTIIAFYMWCLRNNRNIDFLLRLIYLTTGAAVLILIIAPGHRFYPLDMWPYFGMGAVVFSLVKFSQRREPKIWAGILAALMLFCLVWRDIPLSIVGHSSRQSFTYTLVFACLLVWLYTREALLDKIPGMNSISKVGAFSYSLYLTNMFFLGMVSYVYVYLGKHATWVFAIIGALAAIFGAFWFYHFCERPYMSKKQVRRSL